ncbi:hypothetical protein [Lactiplantibacillus herbarum]|uniref:hypothetical protein n=1 Tax=Lactiplantibacillus herbarum TaxID=1670446 RepID=UPI00064FBDFC|nr:hypothetical protein [Lactiplantibacillus herbarum]
MSENFHEMNESEIEVAMSRFFAITHGEYLRDVLNYFSKKQGYSQEYIYICFYYDNDGDENNGEKLQKLDDKHVLIEQDALISYTGKDEFAYLDFPTFYKYVAYEIKKRAEKSPENADLIDLLAKVKKGLGV